MRGDHTLNPDLFPDAPLVPAAVLVPIVEREAGLTVLFTLRAPHLLNHAGQISFPGGRMEPGDGTPRETALRETEEEIGLTRDRIEIIGQLEDYVTRTGFRITPIVAVVKPPFALRPDPVEVAEVFEVPLDFLLDSANHQRHTRLIGGRERAYYAMPYGEHYIWGATAGMLKCLYELVRGDP